MGKCRLVPRRAIRIASDALWLVAVDRLDDAYERESASAMRRNVKAALRAYNAMKKLPAIGNSHRYIHHLRDDVVMALREYNKVRKLTEE